MPRRPETAGCQQRRAFVRGLLAEARPAAGTVVETYLAGRGLHLELTTRSPHQRLWHRESRQHLAGDAGADPRLRRRRRRPASHLAGTRRPRQGAGRAGAQVAGAVAGCDQRLRIRLAAVADEMVIGEGIETTLAAMQMFGRPGWAAIHAGNLRACRLPSGVRRLILVADHDDNGARLREAKAAASVMSPVAA